MFDLSLSLSLSPSLSLPPSLSPYPTFPSRVRAPAVEEDGTLAAICSTDERIEPTQCLWRWRTGTDGVDGEDRFIVRPDTTLECVGCPVNVSCPQGQLCVSRDAETHECVCPLSLDRDPLLERCLTEGCTWLFGCLVVWLLSCLVGWLFGWLAVWLYGLSYTQTSHARTHTHTFSL